MGATCRGDNFAEVIFLDNFFGYIFPWIELTMQNHLSVLAYTSIYELQLHIQNLIILWPDAQWTTLGHYWWDRLTHSISVTAFFILIFNQSLWEPCNKVGSQILAAHLVRIETTNFQF